MDPIDREPKPTPAAPQGAQRSEQGKVCPSCGTEYAADTWFCPRDGSALVPNAAEDELLGRVIAGRYRVQRKLGEGGMGRVYLAEHVRMGRLCALKVLNPELLHRGDAIARFAREAASASRINHPNVASIYDFGETEDGVTYLAMEYAEGERLSALIAREGPFPPERARAVARQVADSLVTAHEIGIVHRDLKPDNIIVSRARDGGDLVKVIDFGIAKGTHGVDTQLTRTGFVVGTPRYMSPEQVSGDAVDGRSDIYSLGCILYEMLVGQPAFDGPTAEIIQRRLTEPPPRPRGRNQQVPKELDELVLRALARSPADRFASAAELLDALYALGVPDPRVARTPPHGLTPVTAQRAAAPERRGVRRPVLAAAFAVIVVGAAAVAWVAGGRGSAGVAVDAPAAAPPLSPADSAARPDTASSAPSGHEEEPAPAVRQEPAAPVATAEPPPARREPPPAARTIPPEPRPAGPTAEEIAALRLDLDEIARRLNAVSDALEYDPILREIYAVQARVGGLAARYPGSAVLDSIGWVAQAHALEARRVCEQVKQLRASRGQQAPTCT